MKTKKTRHRKERPAAANTVEDSQRLFIAVPVSAEVKAAVGEIVEALSPFAEHLRFVSPDAAHLTLHFLGPVPPEQSALIRMGLQTPRSTVESFTLGTAGLGVFPSLAKPRVLWLGINGQTDAFANLHRDIGMRMQALGLDVDTKRPVPHVTIGRVRDSIPGDFAARLERTLRNEDLLERVDRLQSEFTVSDYELIQSHLEKQGPRYETLGRYPLR